MNNDSIGHPLFKWVTVFAAWISSVQWGNWASMVACIYTLLLIFDWWWKRFGKALFIRFGWLKGRPRDFMDSTVRGDDV